MKIKTYVFEDVKKGIDSLKEQFGPDTVILDIKDNGNNGHKKSCEISVVMKDEASPQDDPMEFRRKSETIWNHTTKLLIDKIAGLESEIVSDRVRSYPLPLRIFFDKMVRNGLDTQLAISIVSDVYGNIGNFAEDSIKANFFLKDIIAERIKINDITSSNDSILVLGPSGAGKTQTVKKLAKLHLAKEKQVSIISYDPVRKGVCDELMSFAEEVEIPFSFTSNEDNLRFLIEKGERKKIVDFTGNLVFQKRAVERLREAKKVIVLPAGARDEKIKNYCSQFSDPNIAGLIFTKLDEEETLGHICHNLISLDQPICGLTTGIDIGDIVMPDHEIFYKILLEGNVWKAGERRLLQ